MTKITKQRLIELGEETLAEALLELAGLDERANAVVSRLTATPQENTTRFKARLSSLKRMRGFIRWGESAGFARELTGLLEDLKAGIDDPRLGAELVAAFYETDRGVLGACDDSSGHVGDVYRHDAKELFVSYARRCEDKDWLGNLVLKLNRKDDFGIRDTLIDCATEYLPEPVIRTMIDHIQKLADKEEDKQHERHWLYLIESLARQLKDAKLFEKTRRAAWGSLSTAAYIDIGEVYLESGDPATALSWLERIAVNEVFMAYERDKLLLATHEQLGNKEAQTETAWRIFRRRRSANALARLLTVIGHEQRETVIAGESAIIRGNSNLCLDDAAFLIEMELLDETEQYLLDRADQLNGDFYSILLPLTEAMEAGGHPLTASILYRALLDSILRRAHTRTYPHGIRYLKKLDRLATSVPDWKNFESHAAYTTKTRLAHGRKSSFWSKYDGGADKANWR